VSCQRVISGRQVGREVGQERVAYDVMQPKALRKRDEMAGAGAEAEAEGVPLTITPPLDEHQLDAEESEIGRKGIELKVRAWMCRGAPRQWWVPTSPDDRIVGSGRQLHDIKDWVEASHWGREDQVVGIPSDASFDQVGA